MEIWKYLSLISDHGAQLQGCSSGHCGQERTGKDVPQHHKSQVWLPGKDLHYSFTIVFIKAKIELFCQKKISRDWYFCLSGVATSIRRYRIPQSEDRLSQYSSREQALWYQITEEQEICRNKQINKKLSCFRGYGSPTVILWSSHLHKKLNNIRYMATSWKFADRGEFSDLFYYFT